MERTHNIVKFNSDMGKILVSCNNSFMCDEFILVSILNCILCTT